MAYPRLWQDRKRTLGNCVRGFSGRAHELFLSALIRRHPVNDFGQFCARTKARQLLQFIETWDAPEHVLETGFVRLVIGNVLDRRGTARSLFHQERQIFDGDLVVVAHVDDFTDGLVRRGQAQERFHGIPHVAKAAGLLPRSINA